MPVLLPRRTRTTYPSLTISKAVKEPKKPRPNAFGVNKPCPRIRKPNAPSIRKLPSSLPADIRPFAERQSSGPRRSYGRNPGVWVGYDISFPGVGGVRAGLEERRRNVSWDGQLSNTPAAQLRQEFWSVKTSAARASRGCMLVQGLGRALQCCAVSVTCHIGGMGPTDARTGGIIPQRPELLISRHLRWIKMKQKEALKLIKVVRAIQPHEAVDAHHPRGGICPSFPCPLPPMVCICPWSWLSVIPSPASLFGR